MDAELRALRYFVAVAEELHFGRAARRLRIAQPPLSRAIRRLENELELALFDRTSRRVELTPAGAALLAEARAAIEHVERGVSAARRAQRRIVVRLGFVSALTHGLVPRVVQALQRGHPDLGVELHEATLTDQLAALEAGELDCGLVYWVRSRGLSAPGVSVEALREERVYAVLPASHALAEAPDLSLDELRDDDWFTLSRSAVPCHEGRAVVEDASGRPLVRVTQTATTLRACIDLVAAGMGVTWAPEAAVDAHRDDVVFVPLETEPFVLGLAVPDAARDDLHDRVRITLRRLVALPGAAPAGR